MESIQKDIDTLYSKANEIGEKVAVLENTNKFIQNTLESVDKQFIRNFDVLGSIEKSIAILNVQVKNIVDTQAKNGKKNGNGKSGIMSLLNDWRKPLWLIIVLVIVAAWSSGTTLVEWIGTPPEISP